MKKRTLFFLFLSVLAGLNLGTVRRTEDPVRDTQTNPILYEQKKEEEKDGKKGPLMYHVKYNPREAFFIDPPYEVDKKIAGKTIAVDEVSAPPDTTDWWEEQPAASHVPASLEIAAEPLPEPPPQEKKVPDIEAAEQPPPASGAESATIPGKGDDYWW